MWCWILSILLAIIVVPLGFCVIGVICWSIDLLLHRSGKIFRWIWKHTFRKVRWFSVNVEVIKKWLGYMALSIMGSILAAFLILLFYLIAVDIHSWIC